MTRKFGDFPAEWEYDFRNPPRIKPPEQCENDLERHGLCQCAFCGDLLHQEEVEHFIYYDDAKQHTAFFCGEAHKRDHYLWRMRKGGM